MINDLLISHLFIHNFARTVSHFLFFHISVFFVINTVFARNFPWRPSCLGVDKNSNSKHRLIDQGASIFDWVFLEWYPYYKIFANRSRTRSDVKNVSKLRIKKVIF